MSSAASTVPFSEPPWLTGLPSPYYNESHRRWQKACLDFISEHLAPHALQWETEGSVPDHVFETFSKHNMLIPNLPAPLPIDMLKRLGITKLAGDLSIEEFDYMHFSIYITEMRRIGIGGPASSLSTGMAYGMPPIITYGSAELQNRLLPDLIRGKKRICIAITEPDAGSDVANITTTAEKSPCGKFYVVNGEKKWLVFQCLLTYTHLTHWLPNIGLPMVSGRITLPWPFVQEAPVLQVYRFLWFHYWTIQASPCAE